MDGMRLSDTTTDGVIGVPRVRASIRPYSERAVDAIRDLRTFTGTDRDAWAELLSRCRATEQWWTNADVDGVRRALGELPSLERPLRLLDGAETLDDVALFELKRFLYWGALLIEATDPLDWVPSEWEPRLRETMAAIHPELEASPRFHLAADLDERLGPARKRHKEARRAERSRRRDLEQALVADLGGSFDVRGRYVPDDQEAAASDARLLRTGDYFDLTDERLAELAEEVRDEGAIVEKIENEVRQQLSDLLRSDARWFGEVRETLCELDLAIARVELKSRWNGTWPTWRDDGETTITDGRLPRFIDTLDAGEIQPISVEFDAAPTVVTGPNMGGKSALLELLGICQWCAQHALPVPAREFAFTPVESLIYVGAEEPGGEAGTGLSAFGREVRRVVEGRMTPAPRLWLLDEFGRGTHPEEGADIACRLIEVLESVGDRVVVATHFPSLAAMEDVVHLRIAGLTNPDALREHPDVLEEIERVLRSAMDYRPLHSAPDEEAVPRDARLVAEILGLDLGPSEP
jgi:hypothetical protein